MRCQVCTAEYPYDVSSDEDFLCLFCDGGGKVFPTPVEFLSEKSLGLAREVRQTQLDLTKLIDDTIRDAGVGVFEAGTGVGKSFAYLLPSILTAKGRVLVSTAKKALQEQLIEKDLPLIRQAILDQGGSDFTFAIAYGKSNYICRRKLRASTHDKPVWDAFFDSPKTEWTWDSLTEYTKKGTQARSKKALNVLRYDSNATAENCVGSVCSYASDGTCTYWNAKRAVAAAQVVVTNHWLFGYHIRMGLEKEKPLLGFFDTVIVDEAHKLDDGLRAAFSDGITEERVAGIVRDFEEHVLKGKEWVSAKPVLDANASMFAGVSSASPDGRVDVTSRVLNVKRELQSLLTKMQDGNFARAHLGVYPSLEFGAYLATLGVAQEAEKVLLMTAAAQELSTANAPRTYRAAYLVLSETVDILNKITAPASGESAVTYLGEMRGRPNIITAPVETGPIMQRWLTRDSAKPTTTSPLGTYMHAAVSPRSISFLSATLAVGGSLDVFARRAGVAYNPKLTTGQFGSAFDLARQATLYVSGSIPIPTRGESTDTYRAALADEVYELITANSGNAFVLFTARDEMLDVYSRISSRSGLPILVQNPGQSAADLLAQYRKTNDAVLFGLKSFWEGIDVAGDKLSLVIITKLPFPGRTDAVVNARRENAGDAWFGTVDVPDMIFDLRQGLGRLIRTVTDTGVAAILDSRVLTKPYGKTVLRSTGFTRAHTKLSQVVPVLEAQARARGK